MYFSLVALVLTKALLTEVCDALNVTVVPGPVAVVTESDNLTLSCLVSQRRRASGVLVLRWFFSPAGAGAVLIVRMGIKKMKQYGNYTRRFPQPKFLLLQAEAEPAAGGGGGGGVPAARPQRDGGRPGRLQLQGAGDTEAQEHLEGLVQRHRQHHPGRYGAATSRRVVVVL
ncbi:unnamed protein product [Arctogadus glacialis]